MRFQRNVDTSARILCPWCAASISVPVNLGLCNLRAPMRKRVTAITVRRTAAFEHDCVDPTTVTPR